MNPLTSTPSLLRLLVVLALGLVGPLSAQWLVYELQFYPQADSVNMGTYQSGYLVAPAGGGAASLILVAEDDRRYAVAESAAKFFMAANHQERRAAFSALALSGNGQALYAASGVWDRSLVLRPPGSAQQVFRVAQSLRGTLLVADDESDRGPSPDGSLGSIGSARIEGVLRDDLSSLISERHDSLAKAFSQVLELLQKYGYEPDVGPIESANPGASPAPKSGEAEPSLFPDSALPR
jgi:hypothetical protein